MALVNSLLPHHWPRSLWALLPARAASASAPSSRPPFLTPPHLLLPTCDEHRDDSAPFVGPYAQHRAKLDERYHGRYSVARQAVQDAIVDEALRAGGGGGGGGGDDRGGGGGGRGGGGDVGDIDGSGRGGGEGAGASGSADGRGRGAGADANAVATSSAPAGAPRAPWIVLTAGPMGAGKSHTIRWLTAAGAFPLARFVRVNPDAIKSRLPEHAALVAGVPAAAGSLLHRESGFIAELIERAAVARGSSVLIDGSLRNAEWHEAGIQRLRRAAPAYRLALLLVTASAEAVHRRAANRIAVTGRVVPRELLDDALSRAPAAFARLAPLADYSATILNDVDNAAPVFLPPASLSEFTALWDSPAQARGGEGAS